MRLGSMHAEDSPVENEAKAGFYKDNSGEWAQERRKDQDRRRNRVAHTDDKREQKRRKSDREWESREHKKMVEDALEDFAAEHGEG